MVNIVIPVYNAERTLKQCIRSVLKQSYQNIRVILVDDGSKDKSGIICDETAAQDPRVVVIHQENQGSIAARRHGVDACDDVPGNYICFCDADDVMPHTAIEKLYDSCMAGADISVGITQRLWRNIGIPSRYKPPCFQNKTYELIPRQDFIDHLLCSWFGISNVPVGLWGKLFKASIIKKAYERVSDTEVKFFGEDLLVTLNAFPLAENIMFINDLVYYYRLGGGTAKYSPDMLNDFIALYHYKLNFSKKFSIPQNIQLLSDIELCNVAFTYFEMLYTAKECSMNQLRAEIQVTMRRPEISDAAKHVRSVYDHNVKAGLLFSEDVEAIIARLKPTELERAKKRIKRLICRTA